MQGVFNLTLYNGSDFALREITIEITVRDSHQEEVLQRYYRIVQDHDYRQNGEYAQALDFSVGPQQSWSWKITAARVLRSSVPPLFPSAALLCPPVAYSIPPRVSNPSGAAQRQSSKEPYPIPLGLSA